MKLARLVKIAAAIALVLHVFSCVFMGQSYAPGDLPSGARGEE